MKTSGKTLDPKEEQKTLNPKGLKNITLDEVKILQNSGPLAFGTHVKDRIQKSLDLTTALSICAECSKVINSIYVDKDAITFLGPDGYQPDAYTIEESVYSILDNFDIIKSLEQLAKNEGISLFSNLSNFRGVFSHFIRYANKYTGLSMNVQNVLNRLKKADNVFAKKKLSNIKIETMKQEPLRI